MKTITDLLNKVKHDIAEHNHQIGKLTAERDVLNRILWDLEEVVPKNEVVWEAVTAEGKV